MTFGERLKYLREVYNLKQKDVAERINITPRMIGYYEHDECMPRDSQTIIELAKLFNVSLDYLFGVSDVPRYKNIKRYSGIIAACDGLPKKQYAEVIRYINYLKSEKE